MIQYHDEQAKFKYVEVASDSRKHSHERCGVLTFKEKNREKRCGVFICTWSWMHLKFSKRFLLNIL
jgi:hypothetical protein